MAPPPKQRSPEWIEARKGGIGSSDIAILSGLTPWSSPYQVFLEKTGQADPEPESPAMARGNLLEDPVAQWWARDTGRKVRRRHAILRHAEHDWARASVDRELVGSPEVLEVKTTAERWDEPPDEVIVQVQWQLGVGGYARAHIAALTGGLELKRWEVLPDPEYFADLLVIGEAAWTDISAGRPPVMDGSPATARALARVWRGPLAVDKPALLAADDTMTDMAALLFQAETVTKIAEGHRDTIRNAFRAALGESAGVEGPGWKVTWTRNRPSTKVDWEAVARRLGLADPADFLARVAVHTSVEEGSRVLRTHFDADAFPVPPPIALAPTPAQVALQAGDLGQPTDHMASQLPAQGDAGIDPTAI